MIGVRRFAFNAGIQFGAAILTAVFSFVFTVYAAQKLGSNSFGQFSVVQIFVSSFLLLIDFGLTNVVVREVAQNKGEPYSIASNIITLKTVLGILIFLIIMIISSGMGYKPDTQRLILIYALSVIPLSVTNACISIFNGYEKMTYSIIPTLCNILGYLGSIVALSFGFGVIAVFVIIVVCTFLAMSISLISVYSNFTKFRFNFDRRRWRLYLITAFPFGFITLINMVGISVGPIMLSRINGEESVGYYNLAIKVIGIVMLLISAYNSAVFPFFSRLETTSKIKFNQSYKLSIKFMMITGMSFAVGLSINADKIVNLVFPGYETTMPALRILSFYAFFSLLATVTINILYAENREHEVTKVMLLATLVSLVMNFILIPFYGIIGLCISLVSLTALQFILSYYKVKHNHPLNLLKITLQSAGIALLIGVAGILLHSLNLIIVILVMGVILSFTPFITGIFDSEEKKIFLELPFISNILFLFKIRDSSESITRH